MRRISAAAIGGAILVATGIAASPAAATPKAATISIAKVSAEKSCKIYQESAGSSAAVVTAFGAASAESWRTWLVKDCVNNFATMRASLEADLAGSGKLAVKSKGADYSVTASVSQVGDDGGPGPPSPGGGAYSISSRGIFASMEISIRNASGLVVYGGTLTKHFETASDTRTSGLHSTRSQSGEAVYTELQNAMALAAARVIAFHIIPLKVVGSEGSQIRLNYGSPLLTLGTAVQVTTPDGFSVLRYNVVGADESGALAESRGDGDASKVTAGSLARVLESDSPEANGRVIKRVELPE